MGKVLESDRTNACLHRCLFTREKENFQFCFDDDFQHSKEEAAARELALKSHRINPFSVSKAFVGRAPTFD